MFKVPQNLHRSFDARSFLYFIESGEFVKVGLAEDLKKRLFSLQLGNPLELRLVAWRTIPRALSIQTERAVHAELVDFAIGREWFRMDGRTAVKRADPIVKKAHATVLRWRSRLGNLDTGREVTIEDLAQLIEVR